MHLDRRTLLAALPVLATRSAFARAPLRVVASFSILADLVAEIGGEDVRVGMLVGPDGDAHVFQPSPADARALGEADLVIVNGLGFEGWLDRLIAASGYRGPVVEASADALLLAPGEEADHDRHHAHGGMADPHCWQSVPNAIRYVRRIAQALRTADPGHAAAYAERARTYEARLLDLDHEIRAMLAAIPAPERRILTSHDAFAYFGHAYGITILAAAGVSTAAEPSARDVAGLIREIRATGVRAVFVENVSDPRLVRRIAEETGVELGGRLYSDALSGPDGPAATYVEMMRHNARAIAGAMRSS